jgi:hypothetical protein
MALTEQEKKIAEYGKKSGKSKEEVLKALDRYRDQQKVSQPKEDNILTKLGKGLISSEQGLAEDVVAASPESIFGFDVAGKKMVSEARQGQNFSQQQLINKIRENRSKGLDTSRLESALKQMGGTLPSDEELYPALKKTNKQIVGDVAGVTADILTAGSLSKAIPGAIKAVKPAKTVLQAFKAGTKTALVPGIVAGGSQGFAGGMQANKSAKDILLDTMVGAGVGAATAPVAGLVSGGAKGVQKVAGLAREGIKTIGEQGEKFAKSKLVSAIGQKTKEFGERFPRALERMQESTEKSAAKAAKIKTATPTVRKALEADLDEGIINTVTSADEPTVKGYKEIVDIAKKSKNAVGTVERPSIVAGRAASEQFSFIDKQRKKIGKEIGDSIKELSKEKTVELDDTLATLESTLEDQGIKFSEGKLTKNSFAGTNLTPSQRTKITELWKLTNEGEGTLSPYQIWKKDNLFSQLQRDARFEGVGDILVDMPDGSKKNIFSIFRDVFSKKLDEVSPTNIRKLNKEYRDLLVFTDDIENSILRGGGNFESVKNIDPAEFAQTNLRRIMSDAQSAGSYSAIVKQMDELSRKLGYTGAKPEDLINFAEAMRRIYTDIIPKSSFQGGIQTSLSVMDAAKKLLEVGKVSSRDQQKALEGLLDSLVTK